MKKIILTSIITMAISTSAFSIEVNGDAESQLVSMLTSTGIVPVAISIYNPSLGGIIAVGTVAATIQLDKMKTKQLQYAVNTDIEEYRATGELSIALKQIIDQVKEENSLLSEAETIDMIEIQINLL